MLHRVLNSEAHINGFEKKKKLYAFICRHPVSFRYNVFYYNISCIHLSTHSMVLQQGHRLGLQ